MRITQDLIQNSFSFINPLKERELDLRGHQIPAIENLGVATKDHDCLNFTDNEITVLGNFPLNPRLSNLMLARNKVSSIQPNLATSIPALHTLILTDNSMRELADLDPLSSFAKLTHLSLLGNPVQKRDHYRHWLVWRCANLRYLDFQKVTQDERTQAAALFGTLEKPTDLARQIMANRSALALHPVADRANGIDGPKTIRAKLSAAEKKWYAERINEAQTLAEISRLEKELAEGKIPTDVEMKG